MWNRMKKIFGELNVPEVGLIFAAIVVVILLSSVINTYKQTHNHDFLQIERKIDPMLAPVFGPIVIRGFTIPRISEVRTTTDHSRVCLQQNGKPDKYVCFTTFHPVEITEPLPTN